MLFECPFFFGSFYIFASYICYIRKTENLDSYHLSLVRHDFWGGGGGTAKFPIAKFKTAHSMVRKNSSIDSDGQTFCSNQYDKDQASSQCISRARCHNKVKFTYATTVSEVGANGKAEASKCIGSVSGCTHRKSVHSIRFVVGSFDLV